MTKLWLEKEEKIDGITIRIYSALVHGVKKFVEVASDDDFFGHDSLTASNKAAIEKFEALEREDVTVN